MFQLRSRISVSHPTESRLVLRSNPGRRVLFGFIGGVLLVAFSLSVDWQSDFGGGMAAGTVFYFVLTATCVGVAAWGSSIFFDSESDEISFTKSLAGIEVHRDRIGASAVKAVTIQGIRFLKDSERPQPGLLNNRFRTYIERRNNYYKLYLDMGEERKFVEDSTDVTDLDAAAAEIAGFLHVTLRREEI